MAVTEQILNLDFPSVTDKEATVDLSKAVTTDSEGDERYLLTGTPGTTTQAEGAVDIDPVLIEFVKSGYVRSSGFKNPPFTITVTNNTLLISIDGSTPIQILLESGTGLTGDDIADDLQNKINLLAATGGAAEGNLAFLNAVVSFENNRFVIISGSLARSFTGAEKSSVAVTAGASNDASVTIGFDVSTSSEAIASKLVTEGLLTGPTTTGAVGEIIIPLNDVTAYSAGQAITIYNGADRDYSVIAQVSGNNLVSPASTIPAATYSGGAIVQNIFERDSDSQLASPYESVDDITRAIIRTIAGQIDFS